MDRELVPARTAERPMRYDLSPGMTVSQALSLVMADLPPGVPVVCWLNGTLVTDCENTRVMTGDRLICGVMPQGGGGSGKSVGMIVVGIILVAMTWGGGAAAMGWTMSATTMSAVGMIGVGLILSGVSGLLIKPPALNSNLLGNNTEGDRSYYSFTGQSNQTRPYQIVPRVYGRHRMFPSMAATPIINNVGTESYITALYDFGPGIVSLEDIQIGETDIYQYQVQTRYYPGQQNPSFTWFHDRSYYQTISHTLQPNEPKVITTTASAIGVDIDIVFNGGLARVSDTGALQDTSVRFLVEYAVSGSGNWVNVYQDRYSGARIGVVYESPPVAQYVQAAVLYRNIIKDGQTVRERVYVVPLVFRTSTYNWRDVDPIEFEGEEYLAAISPIYGWTCLFWVNANVYGYSAWSGYVPDGWAWESPFNANPGPVTPATAMADVINNSFKPFVLQVYIPFQAVGQYDIRITRYTAISTDTRLVNSAVWTQARSLVAGASLKLDRPHTILEVFARADERLSGVIQNLSAIATAHLRQTNDGVNFWTGPTRNPAWVALDVLQGTGNPRPVPDSLIDWPSWIAFATYCATNRTWKIGGKTFTQPRHTFDAIIDYEASIKELVDSVLSSCRAMVQVTATGLYGIVIDEAVTVPRQVITPANSWNFRGTRKFAETIHALRVSYVSSASAYNKAEVVVYRDGYSASNATLYEDLGTFGITDHYRAWAFGRYFLAQATYRAETFSVDMSVENLVVTRGDLVYVSHDVPKVGGFPCRVVSVSGSDVKVSQILPAVPSAYTVRLQTGTIRTGTITAIAGADTVTLDNATGISPEDLMILGQADTLTNPYIVQAIEPGPDLSATLTLVPYSAALYNADIGQMPVWEPNFSDDTLNASSMTLTNLAAVEAIEYVNKIPYSRARLTWEVAYSLYDHVAIYLDMTGASQKFLGYVGGYVFDYSFNTINSPEIMAGEVTFTVVPYTASGTKGTGATITYSGTRDTTPPAAVYGFSTNIQSEHVSIFWRNQTDPDIAYHEIRFSPDPVDGQWGYSQILARLPDEVNQFVIGARTGKYMLRSIDTSGNASPVVFSRTAVADLPYKQFTERLDDTPDWLGKKFNFSPVASDLEQTGEWGDIADESYYYFVRTVDLGAVYQIRATTYLTANAVMQDDLLSSEKWIPVSGKDPLVQDNSTLFDASIEYRAADSLLPVSGWVPTIATGPTDPVGGVTHALWTDWREIQVGDITGRMFQFRVKYLSWSVFVRGHIDEAQVDLYMVNRPVVIPDVAIAATGTYVEFDPPFMATPLVNVGIDGGTAYRYALTDKSPEGVTITLYEGDTAVSGQVDIFCLGYGIGRTTTL